MSISAGGSWTTLVKEERRQGNLTVVSAGNCIDDPAGGVWAARVVTR